MVFGLGNLTSGATIGGTAERNGNVISGNAGHGVWAGPFSSGNIIQGNFIGTSATGDTAVGNQLSGVLLNGNGTIVGGLTTSVGRFAGNVVSGNQQSGIATLATGSVIQGNIIGLNAAGNAALKNHFSGIGNLGGGSSLTQIGGTDPRAKNVIAGNGGENELSLYGVDRWSVQGNLIGTDVLGVSRIQGAMNGIAVDNGSQDVLIGGNIENSGNLISGYTSGSGIIVRQGSDNTVIAGNLIGTDLTSAYVIGNQVGIWVDATLASPV